MVAPAIIPLLGLLGGALALDPLKDQRRRRQGRRQQAALEGVDPNDPRGTNRALFNAGFLDANQFTGNDLNERQLGENTRQFNASHGLASQKFQENVRQFGLTHALNQRRTDLAEQAQQSQSRQYWGAQVNSPDGVIDMGAALGGLIQGESGGNANAVSPKGAAGLGQIMPANIVPWTRKHFPQYAQLSDQAIAEMYRTNNNGFQEKLASAEFGRYVQQYGLREAFVKWHAGEGTDWQQVVNDYSDAQRTGNTGRYHDGGIHTYDYVRQMLQRYERNAGQNAAQRESDETYIGTVQPLADRQQNVAHGLEILPNLPMSDNLTVSGLDAAAVQQLNQTLMQQRMDYWNTTLGRSDAPSEAEVAQLANMFPLVGEKAFDGTPEKRREVIEQNLLIYQEQTRRAIETAQGTANRAGFSTPGIEGRGLLPEGWTPEVIEQED